MDFHTFQKDAHNQIDLINEYPARWFRNNPPGWLKNPSVRLTILRQIIFITIKFPSDVFPNPKLVALHITISLMTLIANLPISQLYHAFF